MPQCNASQPQRYLDSLAQGVEAWTAQGVNVALTGGYEDPHQNQTMLAGWPERPITNAAEFWSQTEAVSFETRGIAAIHGAGYGTFALDMDGEEGRADFVWLEERGFIRPGELVMDTPNGHHVIVSHDDILTGGTMRHPRSHDGHVDRTRIVIDGFDGPRGDGTLCATTRGASGAQVTKLPPTLRPITGEPYTARLGWRWEPLPLWGWFNVEQYEPHEAEPLELFGDGSRYGNAALVGEVSKVLSARNGARNQTLFLAALNLGQLVAIDILTENVVRIALTDAADHVGHTRDHGERSTHATIRSGLNRGIRNPRRLA